MKFLIQKVISLFRPSYKLFLKLFIVVAIILIYFISVYLLAPTPKDIRITNIGSSSFTVNFLTSREVKGCALAQIVDGEYKVKGCSTEPTKVHQIHLSGFWPENDYEVSLTIGLKPFGSGILVTTIPERLTQPAFPNPSYGSVYFFEDSPVSGAIVYVSNLEGTSIISTKTNAFGGFAVDLSNIDQLGERVIIEIVVSEDLRRVFELPVSEHSPFPTLVLNANEEE